jgi:putative ABC transport system permease protein
MRMIDYLKFALDALTRHRIRTVLILLAMSIGVASILILTSLGKGAQRYVRGEFASLGTNLVIIIPGRTETTGAGPPTLFIGETPRDLTLQDAQAIKNNSNIRRVAPLVVGQAAVSYGGKERDVPILGSTSELLDIRHWQLSQGKFLPLGDIDRAAPVCVIGTKVKTELFGPNNALGEWLRIGDRRFRVIGILASEGRSIGLDVQELAIIPAASAQSLFNTPSLFRIFVEARSRESIPSVIRFVERTIAKRHQGEKDVTVITQDAVLATFDKILGALTMTVGGIAAISLVVAGILIMNVMLVSVAQRTSEIGLLKALGSPQRQITFLFLTEAFLLSAIGALIGVLFGETGSWIIGLIYPSLPLGAPMWALISSIIVAISTGLLFAALPARRAAKLDPVEALAHK